MVALTAEINNSSINTYAEWQPLPLAVPELQSDKLVRARAARFIGNCVTNQEIDYRYPESGSGVQSIESLYDAVRLAAEGDPVARKMVETNVRTDVIERTIKAGHVIEVDLFVDEAGKIQQHGQSYESIQANSLRLAADMWQMRERTEAEAINAFRIEDLHSQGILEDYYFVVFSRAADNMTDAEMNKVGFFTDTMSCAIQVTSSQGDRLVTESAFVAGTKKPGDVRHDAETLAAVGKDLNIDFSNKTAAGSIALPVLIPKKLIPNGAIDIVRLWDKPNGTFFGEDKPAQDYIEYRAKCRQREAMLQPKVEAIVQELINEASTIKDRVHATQRLHKLSEKHMVEQAVFDHEINPKVFGSTAASHILQARVEFGQGNIQAGFQSMNQAKQTAKSSSCPSINKGFNMDIESELNHDRGVEVEEDKFGPLEFDCPNGHRNKRERNKLMKKCGTCRASVTCEPKE